MMPSSSIVVPDDGNPNTSITSTASDTTTANDGDQSQQTQQQQHQRLQCPCYKFTSLSAVESLVGSEEQTNAMIDWLNGTTDRRAIEERRILSCGKRSQCRFRYGTAFVVLQAIRDVCAPHLKENEASSPASASGATTTTTTTNAIEGFTVSTKEHPAMSNFLQIPSSSSSKPDHHHQQQQNTQNEPNVLMGRKKQKSNKSKRRVRPQLTNTDPINVDRSWGANNESINLEKKYQPLVMNGSGNSNNAGVQIEKEPINKNLKPSTLSTKHQQPPPSEPPLSCLYVTPTKGRIPGAPTTAGSSPSMILFSTSPSSSSMVGVESLKTPVADVVVVEAPTENVERLARIFVSLIDNMLVPSTLTEIGGLLQLLSIRLSSHPDRLDENAPGKDFGGNANSSVCSYTTTKTRFFSSIFSSPQRCVDFAQRVLVQIQRTIRNLPPFVLSAIFQCDPIQENMPDELRACLGEAINAGQRSSSSFVSISVEGNSSNGHAIFSLPFQRDRDSRHNFTTQAEITLFKNREETRDAFLSLLRSFMTSKSKAFLPNQIEKVRQEAGQESKAIFSKISHDNIPWFGQFFIDLLLQIGMAPVEEMDQDVLKLAADNDKLQKLHRRLSATTPKGTTTYRNGHNPHNTISAKHFHRQRGSFTGNTIANGSDIIIQNGNNTANPTPFQEALRYFPGYQEFFFVFLVHVDSYNFGIHLSRRIASLSLKLLSNQSATRGLEKRICHLLLLGRYLGYLVFSPNWRDGNIDWSKIQPAATIETLKVLESIGLPIPSLVHASWERADTLTFIPWVTDLLKLGKWDTFSLTSKPFRQIFANLRCIQQFVNTSEADMLHGQSMEIVSCSLETFFYETVTLARMTSLPRPKLSIMRQVDPQSLDAVHVSLNKSTIFVSNPNVESLFNIVMDISEARPKTTAPSPRKVRPSLIGASQIQVVTAVEEQETGDVGQSSTTNDSKHSAVKKRLLVSFFHQHRDIKDICDFCLSTSIKSLTSTVLDDILAVAIRELNISPGGLSKGSSVRKKILEVSEKMLKEKIRSKVADGIDLFKPSDSHPKVIEIATKVTVDRGMEACLPRLRSIVDKKLQTAERRNTNKDKDDRKDTEKLVILTGVDQVFLAVIDCMNNARKEFKSNDIPNNEMLMNDVIKKLQDMDNAKGIPNENIVRSFFSVTSTFDMALSGQIISLLLKKGSSTTNLLSLYLKTASLLAKHSKNAMADLDNQLIEHYSALISIGLPESLLGLIKERLS